MEKKDLTELKKKLSKLSELESKQRDVYLRKIATGEMAGPKTGYANIDKPWLQYYTDKGILVNVPKMTAYQFLKECNKDRNHNIINFMGFKISVKKFFALVEDVKKSLSSLGVKKDDVVVINSVTLPQSVLLFYALNDLGAIANITDLRTDAEGMKHYIKEGNSKFIFTIDMTYERIKGIANDTGLEKIVLLNPMDMIPGFVKTLSEIKENRNLTKEEKNSKKSAKNQFDEKVKDDDLTILWNEFIGLGSNTESINSALYEPDKIAAIVHTSGTTGMPKSIALTNDNFNAMPTQYVDSPFKNEIGDSILNIIPMFTAYGLVNSLHFSMCIGITDIVYPKVVEDDFPTIMKKYKPNHVLAIPMHWEFMLSKPDADMDLSFLKAPGCGGDKLNLELEKRLNEYLKAHNCPSDIVKGYGMTEVSACVVTSYSNVNLLGSVGIPHVKNNVRIISPDTDEDMLIGEKGEILISTPCAMKEYYKNAEDTAAIVESGEDGLRWVHSGDLGHFNENGQLFIDGRLKRLIIRKGFKISAVAIENAIMMHEDIEYCAVVKVPDELEGELPFAFVVFKETAKHDVKQILSEIDELCEINLPEFSKPEFYKVIDEIPHTKNQKVDVVLLEKRAIELRMANIKKFVNKK